MRVYRDDQKFLTFRINALLWGIVAVFIFLAGAFWFVQSVQAEKWRNLSEANALRELIVPAKRGLILDRTGQKILADNQPAYTLTLDRVVMRPLVKGDATHRPKLITFLSQVLDPDHSMRQAVARLIAYRVSLQLPACSSDTRAYSKARQRLPEPAVGVVEDALEISMTALVADFGHELADLLGADPGRAHHGAQVAIEQMGRARIEHQ